MTIVGEHDFAVRAHLIAREGVELERDRGGPLPSPAAGPVRALPAREAAGGRAAQRQQHRRGGADGRASPREPWAAIGARAAAELYGCTILREGIEDEADNVTRFVWIAPARDRAGRATAPGRPRWSSPSSARTTRAPWSTRCASSPAASVNLTRIESRPLRQGLGRYMFFCDLEGGATDEPSPRRSRRCGARPNRCGSSAPTRSAECPARVRRIPEQDGTSAGTQRDV